MTRAMIAKARSAWAIRFRVVGFITVDSLS
jgi:hypothetical protein